MAGISLGMLVLLVVIVVGGALALAWIGYVERRDGLRKTIRHPRFQVREGGRWVDRDPS